LAGIEAHIFEKSDQLGVSMTQEKIEQLKAEYDYIIIAVGTHQPKIIPFPGHERVIPAFDYLKAAKNLDHEAVLAHLPDKLGEKGKGSGPFKVC
jgi:NADPH-dependent glutamate synthase beta subunit-like oxidoreductase